MSETSTKPYLIRAIHEWCSDNGYTPYLAVAVDERTQVPREFVKNGEIVLNVSPMATNRLSLGNDVISFQARFGGAAREIAIPIENVSAIYARENGHGMAFDVPKALALVPTGAQGDAGAETGGESGDAEHGDAGAGEGAGIDASTGARSEAQGDTAPESARGTGRSRKGRSPAPVLSLAPARASSTEAPPDEPDPAAPPPSGRARPRSTKPKLTRVK